MNTTQETEFDYQTYMKESTRGPSKINRGTKARENDARPSRRGFLKNYNKTIKQNPEMPLPITIVDYVGRTCKMARS